MLQALMQYAEREGLGAEPGFERKKVRFVLSFDEKGRFLAVHDFGRDGRLVDKCPAFSQPEMIAGGITRSHPFADSVETVLLVVGRESGSEEQRKKAAAKRLAKHQFFVERLADAERAVFGGAASASTLCDESGLSAVRDAVVERGAKATDKAAIEVGGVILAEAPLIHDWWRAHRGDESSAGTVKGPSMVDIVTGLPCRPAATHPKIRGLHRVGGSPMGDSLVSFDKDAFCSFALSQSCNAAMAGETAAVYAAALNNLLAERSVQLGGIQIVHWFSGIVPNKEDPIHPVIEGLPSFEDDEGDASPADAAEAEIRVRRFLEQLRTGVRAELRPFRFYSLSLSGAAARVMIRDWSEGSLEHLALAVADWFADLLIVDAKGGGLLPPPRFHSLLTAVVRDPRRDVATLPGHLVGQLWKSATEGHPLPGAMYAKALARVRMDIVRDERLRPSRFGLLKAYLTRKGDRFMNPTLNEEHPDPAYHCGRLMAVLADLQRAALGDVGAGVVQRYYPAASTTPSLVLGRLIRNAQFHLDKVSGDRPGLAVWFNERMGGILTRVGDRFPVTLTLDQQGLFALGYYQQLATRSRRPENNQ